MQRVRLEDENEVEVDDVAGGHVNITKPLLRPWHIGLLVCASSTTALSALVLMFTGTGADSASTESASAVLAAPAQASPLVPPPSPLVPPSPNTSLVPIYPTPPSQQSQDPLPPRQLPPSASPLPQPQPSQPPPPAPAMPLPLAQPLAHGLAVVDELNRRFHHSDHESRHLAEAGVVMRNFDGKTMAGQPWLPCPAELRDGCALRGDRFPASLVNHEIPGLSSTQPGFVLRPQHLQLLCSYHSDGATDGKLCDPPGVSASCIPGCWRDAGWHWGEALWCKRPSAALPQGTLYGCAWMPDELPEMIQSQLERHGGGYNEVRASNVPP